MISRVDKIFQELINNDNDSKRHSYAILEKLVLQIIQKYVESQGKQFYSYFRAENSNSFKEYDGYAPDGFDDYIGNTIIEIKFFRSKSQALARMFSDRFEYFIQASSSNIKNIVFVFTTELSKEDIQRFKSRFNDIINVDIWDIRKLSNIINMYEDDFNNIVNNVSSFILDKQIEISLKDTDYEWREKRDKHIEELKKIYNSDNMVLFLGAGVSRDAKIPTWDKLITDLFVSLLQNRFNKNSVEISNKEKDVILNQLISINRNSPLLQARFVRTGLENEFIDVLSKVLYKDCIDNSRILNEITKLCLPVRNATGIHAVVTYNFDDLLEVNFKRDRIKYKTIYQEADIPSRREIGIYHVHGFLPRHNIDNVNYRKNPLVFSEEGYHNLYLDPYHWSNLVQLNFLKEKQGLFIGLSMTDPNLRRLLDIVVRKQINGDICKHYAILPKESLVDINNSIEGVNINNLKLFEKTIINIQEDYFKELGVNIIWIESFSEIPEILKRIRE